MTLIPTPFISTPSLLFLRYSFHPFLPHPSLSSCIPALQHPILSLFSCSSSGFAVKTFIHRNTKTQQPYNEIPIYHNKKIREKRKTKNTE